MLEPASLRRLARTARWAGLRLRLDETIARGARLLPVPLVYGIVALAYIKVAQPSAELEKRLLWGGAFAVLAVLIGAGHAWFRPRARHLGALALDRYHGLHNRITNALVFAALAENERTPLMRVAIDDALQTVRKLSPRRAAPVHLPRELPITGLLVAGLVGISLVEVRTLREVAVPATIEPMVMAPDDVDLFRETAKELTQQMQDPEAAAAARRFNQLMEDIAERRLDRREVFQRLERLERELNARAQAESEALEEGLRNVARELERSELTRPVAEHLAEKKLADAEQALRELAEKLRRRQTPPSQAELERLRQALERASTATLERAKAIEQERRRVQERRRRLLDKKKDKQLAKTEERELDRTQRHLERLDREKKQNASAQKKLSKLDRELAQAAADLAKELGQGAQRLESAAEDINRMAREELSDKEKQRLIERMRELREVLRQQGKGGKRRMQRMQRFAEKARGQRDGQRRGQGAGKSGEERESEVTLGRGAGVEIPGLGDGSGQRPGAGRGPGERSGEAQRGTGSGSESGSGHDPNLAGEASALKGNVQDVSAAGVDTQEGSASSEVIMGAADRGFVGRGYRKVYTDYRAVAEEAMQQDEIPPGYRFYVQRYFQLIRPRE